MGIDINITAGPDKTSSAATVSGSIQHIITNAERSTFQLGDSQLKNAVGKYFGKNPADAFLHSNTAWGDLYKTYSWPQVQTVVVGTKAEILEITSQPVIVKEQTFVNNSKVPGDFHVGISDQVSNSVASSWSTGGTFTIGEAIKVNAEILGTGVESTTKLSYSQSWGISGTKTQTTTVGSSSAVTVTLQPGQSVLARLSASRGVMKVRVTYNAYLMGLTAINYNPTYNGHHFWGLNLPTVMQSAGISNAVSSNEDLEVGYYSNSRIELVDPEGKSIKYARSLADFSGDIGRVAI